jgi:outer membrane receptor protein involved in Fe transport
MSIMVGLRAENANTTLEQASINKTFTNDYFSLFPSVHFIYNLNEDDKLQASYSRRINRPSIDQLNPFFDYTNPNTLHYGNPDLKPEYTNSFEVNILKYFGRVMILPQLFYRKTTDNVSQFQEVRPDGTIGSTYRNMNSSTSYGFEFTISTPIFDWWKISTDVSYYKFKIEGNKYNDNVTNDDYAWNYNLNSMMNFSEKLSLQINSRYRSPVITAQGKTYETFTVDMGLRYQLIKDVLNLNMRAGNVLQTVKPHSYSSGTSYTDETWSTPEYPNIMIGLSYRFQKGVAQSKKTEDRRTEELIDTP